jgi:hypothetical protein
MAQSLIDRCLHGSINDKKEGGSDEQTVVVEENQPE